MARQKSAWDKLSMRDRAQFIRLGVQNGIYDIRAIKGVYNEYHDEDSKENHDYNMAAAIATGFGPDQNKHWPDTFKKSNHPTFSVESIYSTKETPGGTWGPNFKTFEPSDWMINTYGSTPTIEYLQKHDPDVTPVYMGGVLLPEITVIANRFNNGGYVGHWKDGTQEGESQELNNTITSKPITMFEQEIPVQPITITDKMRDDYQSQINQNAWDAAENQFNKNNLFKTSYDDFKKQFFNIYGELPDTLLSSQQWVDSYVNDGDFMSLELVLPTMHHHYNKLAANNVDLQNLVNNFNWDYVTTLMNANKDKTDIMSRYKSLMNNTLSGLQYYSDYYNSPGFKERLNHFRQHQLYKNAITPQESILSKVKEISFDHSFNNANDFFIFGLDYNGKFANYGVGAHEAAHHNTVYNTRLNSNHSYAPEDSTSLYYSPYYKNDYTRIPSSILKILKPSNYTNTHDAEINESYSDLVRTRALLEKLGIYKSTEAGKTFSEEMYDQYLNTEEGKNDRFLQLHNKQQVIDALNLIASNANTTNPFETQNGMLAAFGGKLNHKKSGEEQGESSYLNKVKQSEYPILYNLLSSSRGDAKPRFMNTLGFMFNWMDKDPAIYTGNYYFGDRLGYGTKKQVPQNRNIVNLYLNGDETGFEKLDAKPIVVNGDTLQHSQYKGNILPHDTIYLHSSVKPVVEDYIQSKQLLPINNSFGSYKHTNFFDYPYNLEKYKGTTIDDANRASISFKQNMDGSYYMDVFDLWDLNGTDKNKIGIGIEKKLISDSIDTNGPFILRQNIPIVFSEDTIGESNFLNKISGGKWKDDTVLYSTGGPLYPFSFEKNPFLKTPAVRYDDGGHLFGFGDWLTNVFSPSDTTTTTVNTEPAPLDLGELATRQAYAESRFDSNAVSPANAVGLFQVTPNTLAYYNSKTGNAFTTQDLYDDTINQQVRDWYMNDLMNRPWNTKNNPSDSVQYAKSLGAYNWGPTNLVDTLNKAKADGVDIYNSWDWLTYLPAETRDYINFVLRNQNNSSHRNNVMYNRSTDKYKSKVSAIKSKK